MRDTGFIEHLRELFAPHAQFDARRMFGGWGIYLDGLMCGLVAEGQLYLKTDELSREAFRAAGSAPFVYDGKGKSITMSYWSVPEDALESDEAMAPWARRARAAARAKAAAKPVAKAPGRAKKPIAATTAKRGASVAGKAGSKPASKSTSMPLVKPAAKKRRVPS